MPQIKIATFNVEWLVLAFGGKWKDWVNPTIPASFPGGKVGGVDHAPIADIHGLCRRLAGVIKEMGAQIIGLEEGPPLPEQMEAFVDQFLDGDYVVHHSNSRWQSITSLVHKSIAALVSPWTPPGVADVSKLWSKIPYYPWGAIALASRKMHRLDRHPLLLSFKPGANKEMLIMVLHTKSKFSKLKTQEQWESREPEAVLDALSARAKLSAEVFRVREFLNEHLFQGDALVMGDFNDGPYAELMEREFLIHNIVDELVGSLLNPNLHYRHAMTPDTLQAAKTVSFPDPLEGGAIVEELIDHLLVSPAIWQERGGFRLLPDSCQVEKQAYLDHYADTGPQRQRELRPSDHKPVSAIFQY